MQLDEIKALVAQAKAALEDYNRIANELAKAGVTIEIDTINLSHGVVGIGKVDHKEVRASFALELD